MTLMHTVLSMYQPNSQNSQQLLLNLSPYVCCMYIYDMWDNLFVENQSNLAELYQWKA